MPFPSARAVIFDLDGTLVDSGLDFDQMRVEMELPAGRPILEGIAELPAARAAVCRQILDRHEQEGAARASPMPHALQLLSLLSTQAIPWAVLTRNSRPAAEACLARLPVAFDLLLAREDAPPKPDPGGILQICQHWGFEPVEVAMVGDYRFDLEAARQAGSRAVLYTQGRSSDAFAGFPQPDYVLHSFATAVEFLAWLQQPI